MADHCRKEALCLAMDNENRIDHRLGWHARVGSENCARRSRFFGYTHRRLRTTQSTSAPLPHSPSHLHYSVTLGADMKPFLLLLTLSTTLLAQKPLTIENIFADGGLTGRPPEAFAWSPDNSRVTFVQR